VIEIYTDGACSGNPGPGGWAAVILENRSKRAIHGRESETTNNRMELMGVIKGLEATDASSTVKIFSDSQYVVNTMTRNWKRRANGDLWAMLDAEVAKRDVAWEWVRGHAGNPLNEEADVLASGEAGFGSGRRPKASLSHIDESGGASMVDVGHKSVTERVAEAAGSVTMQPETLRLIRENNIAKGDVFGTARIAGIMGAKSTSQLIPLCHPLQLDHVAVDFDLNEEKSAVDIKASATTTAKTGVEMEAMTAVAVAGLTIYDMCKSVDRGIRLDGVRLVRKSGGKSGDIVMEG